MDEPHLPVSQIQHEFEEYHFLLPALDACVKYVLRHKVGIPHVHVPIYTIAPTCIHVYVG